MMRFLRIVLVQDAVQMRKSHPNLYLWRDPFFLSPEFLAYEQECLSIPDSAIEEPAHLELQRVLPELVSRMDSQHESIHSIVNHVHSDVRANAQFLNGMQSRLSQGFLDIGRSLSSHGASSNLNGVTPTNVIQATNSSTVPVYTMDRSVISVKDLWREYTEGIAGGPAVRALEAAHGAKWRKSDKERRFFNRRKFIWLKIEELVGNGSSEEEAVDHLENIRLANNFSLSCLQEFLKQ